MEATTSQLDALLRTLAVEIPVGLLCLWLVTRRSPEPPVVARAWWRAALVLAGCSLVTHPFAWWGNRAMAGAMPFEERAAIVEVSVVLVEGAVIRAALSVRVAVAWGTALAMNAASFGYGVWSMLR